MIQQLDIYMSDTTAEPKALHLAEVYAQALLDSLPKGSDPSDIADELRQLDATINNTPGAYELLTSPVVSTSHKVKIANEIGQYLSEPAAGLIQVLARNHRCELLGHIAKACDKVAMKKAGTIELIARTAVPVSDETLKKIQHQLGEALGANCQLENIVDPQIVGGLVLQKGDTVFDASLAGGLERIAEAIEQKNSPDTNNS